MSFFQEQVQAWSNPPVDDVGYIPSANLLALSDEELLATVHQMHQVRYSLDAWRNWDNGWREGLRMDTTYDKLILDFGCGVGMESAELAMNNEVMLADISMDNIRLAQRVMGLYGLWDRGWYLIGEELPDPLAVRTVDVVHCAGVLHHIPDARRVIEWFANIMWHGGEVRLMLYSDRGWRTYVGTEPPLDTVNDEHFDHFVRTFDQVGSYAEWYNEYKIEALAEGLFDLVDFRYITVDDRYCTAVLVRR